MSRFADLRILPSIESALADILTINSADSQLFQTDRRFVLTENLLRIINKHCGSLLFCSVGIDKQTQRSASGINDSFVMYGSFSDSPGHCSKSKFLCLINATVIRHTCGLRAYFCTAGGTV